MFLKLFAPVLFFLAISSCAFCQDDVDKTDAERQADSILKRFLNESGADPRFEEGIDSARLEEAENDYMDNFLKLERDPKKELLHKRVIQWVIGVALFVGCLAIIRRRKKNKRGDSDSSRS